MTNDLSTKLHHIADRMDEDPASDVIRQAALIIAKAESYPDEWETAYGKPFIPSSDLRWTFTGVRDGP